MKKFSVLFVYMVAASVVSGCNMDDGITGFFQCLNDHTAVVSETDFNSERLCNKEYTCESVPTPENYESSDSNYYLCYRCEEGTIYCNNECVPSDEKHCGGCDNRCGINQTCENYRCTPPNNCVSGTFKCDDSQLMVCNNGDWSPKETCSSGMICDSDVGKCIVCKPNTYHCDGAELQKCEQGSWKLQETCGSADQCDAENNRCKCNEGSHQCEGTELRVCRDGIWESKLTCASEELCDADNGKCRNCIEDTYQCSGGMGGKLSQCQDDDWAPAKSCESTELCNAEKGLCLACDADIYTCDGKALKHCSNGSWEPVQECGSGMKCDENSGKCISDSDDDGVPDKDDFCPYNPEKTKEDVCGCNKDFPDESGGCGNTFHIYQANDLKKYKAFSSTKCDEYPHVVLHGQINLIDYDIDKTGDDNNDSNVSCSDFLDISSDGECSPMIFEGESLNGIEPEIIYESKNHSDNTLCKVTSSLFESFKPEVEIKNIKLSYSIKGDVNGVLAASLNKANLTNVHYQGDFDNNSKYATNSGGIVGACSGCNVSDVSFKGNLSVLGEGILPRNIGGLFGKTDKDCYIGNVSYDGKIIVNINTAFNLGGISGLNNGSEMNGVNFRGTIEVSDKSDRNKDNYGIGGIVGTIDNGFLKDVSTDKLSILASHRWNVGGVAGYLTNSQFNNLCKRQITIDNIDGLQNVGGIAGVLTTNSSVLNVHSSVDTVSGKNVVGGFVGYMDSASLNSINHKVNAISGTNGIGGFIGVGSKKLVIESIESTVGDISANPGTDSGEKSELGQGCSGGFAAVIASEEDDVLVKSVKSHVDSLVSNHKVSDSSGTGGFVGFFYIKSISGGNGLIDSIINTVDLLKSSTSSGGFVGIIDIQSSFFGFKDSLRFKNIFSWSNLEYVNIKNGVGGFLGKFRGTIGYGSSYAVSASRLKSIDDDTVIHSALYSYACHISLDQEFYIFTRGDNNTPYYKSEKGENVSKCENNMKNFNPFSDATALTLPKDSGAEWSIQSVTVGDETKNMPIFDLPSVCAE